MFIVLRTMNSGNAQQCRRMSIKNLGKLYLHVYSVILRQRTSLCELTSNMAKLQKIKRTLLCCRTRRHVVFIITTARTHKCHKISAADTYFKFYFSLPRIDLRLPGRDEHLGWGIRSFRGHKPTLHSRIRTTDHMFRQPTVQHSATVNDRMWTVFMGCICIQVQELPVLGTIK
jgi:hypothetical protein